MPAFPVSDKPRGLALLLGWPRLRFSLMLSGTLGLMIGLGWDSGFFAGLIRSVIIGLVAMLAFGLFEQWPRRLPSWLARWALQVLCVAIAIPVAAYGIYVASTADGAPPFWKDSDRMGGFAMFTIMGLLIAPWAALAALVRQKEALAREQALRFDLDRSELERQALDARLHLLQAQVAPHFLFNTLANVQALVDAGSPRAAAVLRSLVAYLRAAVPRLHEQAMTLGQELQLVQAYLELMHMRIPDRLQFSVQAEPSTLGLHCPPMSLLTLVENAVRHGIDPSEEGGRIDITVHRDEGRCRIRVSDTGVGLRESADGLGTGLWTLRERLRLSFDGAAQLRVMAQMPRGVCAELDIPAREAQR
ncbi:MULTISPECIES: sensor histidine kinase [Hydrocarboniphaga]|jgi:signal transduction histidine kinase|nr:MULTISPECIES: histidine kinase [Hydrocarboniphaga]MDZ4078764.1 histidine kinase [Hydrocarboniphaga sp.]